MLIMTFACTRVGRCAGAARRYLAIGVLLLSSPALAARGQSAMPPEPERQLAREIYKEMVEIKSGYTTGRDDARCRGRGAPAQGRRLPRGRHLRRRRDTDQGQPRRPLPRHRPPPPAPAARAHRRRRGQARRLEHGPVHAHRDATAISTAAARATTRRRRRSGSRTSSATSVKASSRTATSSSRSPPTKKAAGPTTASSWLLKNKRDLIDAEFCLNEGGWGESVAGKRIANDVQVSEKYVINYRLEVRNKGGHSSLPVADNAIYHLAGALDRLSKFAFPLKTNDVTQAYFRAMAKIEDGPRSAAISRRSPTATRRRWSASRARPRRGTRRCARRASPRSSRADTRRTRCRSSPPRT